MTTTSYHHWRDVPERVWRWPNFSPAEITCRGTGKLRIDEPALDKLQALKRAGKGGAALQKAVAVNADAHAKALASVIADLQGQGHTSLRALARKLNASGMKTRRGGRWHVSTVWNLLERLPRDEVRSDCW